MAPRSEEYAIWRLDLLKKQLKLFSESGIFSFIFTRDQDTLYLNEEEGIELLDDLQKLLKQGKRIGLLRIKPVVENAKDADTF